MSDRPRVLVIAEAANPDWVSVPLVGWSLAHALRDVADVHLVTQIRNREAILRAGYEEGKDFTAIDTEALAAPLNRLAGALRMGSGKGWTMVTAIAALSYPYFERLVWKQFGPSIRDGSYDIVHRVTPLTPTTVSPLARKCSKAGVPFILGPLNGGVPWPRGFDAERRREKEWLSYVRDAYRLLPGRRSMYRNTAAILTGSRHTQSEVPEVFRDKTVWLPENAIDPTRFNRAAAPYESGPLRAVFIGRLVPYKGVDMLLAAAAPFLRDGRMHLDIIGDGPARTALEAQGQRDGTGSAVTFHGNVEHKRVQDIAATCHVLTFPSVREFGGGVVLEAMALGIVPVVVDYAGPGELVTPRTGFKIPIGTRDQIIKGLGDQLAGIVENPDVLAPLATNARQEALEHYTWSAKARKIAAVYDRVLDVAQQMEPEGQTVTSL